MLDRLLEAKANQNSEVGENDKDVTSNRKSVTDSYKRAFNNSSYSENRPSKLKNLLKSQAELYRQKPGTHSGTRFSHFRPVSKGGYLTSNGLNVNQDLKHRNNGQFHSVDMTSGCKMTDFTKQDDHISKDILSPKSLVNSIIDQ